LKYFLEQVFNRL